MSQPSTFRNLLYASPEWDDCHPLERLRKERTTLKQKEVASMLGAAESTYRGWMAKDKEPPLSSRQIQMLCKILGISFDEYCDLFKDYES